jgi:hypothetical protein
MPTFGAVDGTMLQLAPSLNGGGYDLNLVVG